MDIEDITKEDVAAAVAKEGWVKELAMYNITEEQKQLLQQTTLENGMNAWDYVQSESEADQPWAIAGILSCMKKGYNLNSLMICWEARELRYRAE